MEGDQTYTVPRRFLGGTGVSLPVIGFGAAPLGGVYGEINLDSCKEAVSTAIKVRTLEINRVVKL